MSDSTRSSLAALSVLALGLTLAACQGGGSNPLPATGAARPTVAGGAAPGYANLADAQRAFTRMSPDGVLIATLEDSAWIRFEADPDTATERHRAYFEYGYTTFNVTLRSQAFTRPTDETFLLEDSTGARHTASPLRYDSAMTLVDDRYQYTFDLSFKHVITKEVRWLKLIRQADNETVEWTFDTASPANVPVTREQ